MPLFIQLTGSAIALAAFIATQAGWISATSARYLTLNIIGSAALVASATAERKPMGLLDTPALKDGDSSFITPPPALQVLQALRKRLASPSARRRGCSLPR